MASRGRSNFAAKVSKYRRTDEDEEKGDLGSHFSSKTAARLEDDFDEEEAQATSKRFAEIEGRNAQDEQFGFIHYASGPSKTGWILNMKSVTLTILNAFITLLLF